MFRGREQAHPERGRALLQRLFDDIEELATIESAPLQEGRNMSMMLAPTRGAGDPAAGFDGSGQDGSGEAPTEG
jgi:translation initiation factor IF-3